MRKIIAALVMTMMLSGTAFALQMAGVNVEPAVTVNGHALKLNGTGLRKKFFIKVYVGSLYATKRLTTAPAALQDNGDKLIRMNFVHSKVEKEKIIAAFNEGIAKNTPDLAGTPEAKKFLSIFTDDFKRGDVVDLFLGADGTVSVTHNAKPMGTVSSQKLAKGVLAIYLGDKPADEALKQGMLGRE